MTFEFLLIIMLVLFEKSTKNYWGFHGGIIEIWINWSIPLSIWILTNSLALWNPKVHCSQDISTPCYPILGKGFLIILITYLFQFPNYVNLQSNFRSTRWALLHQFSLKKLVYPSFISHPCNMPYPAQSTWLKRYYIRIPTDIMKLKYGYYTN